jgi:hypothetical protein
METEDRFDLPVTSASTNARGAGRSGAAEALRGRVSRCEQRHIDPSNGAKKISANRERRPGGRQISAVCRNPLPQ